MGIRMEDTVCVVLQIQGTEEHFSTQGRVLTFDSTTIPLDNCMFDF